MLPFTLIEGLLAERSHFFKFYDEKLSFQNLGNHFKCLLYITILSSLLLCCGWSFYFQQNLELLTYAGLAISVYTGSCCAIYFGRLSSRDDIEYIIEIVKNKELFFS